MSSAETAGERRDAVMLQHSYEIFGRHVELSVHDNVLLVHHLDSSTVLLLDVRARSNGPIAGPLPLAVAVVDKVCTTSLVTHTHAHTPLHGTYTAMWHVALPGDDNHVSGDL